MDLGHGAGEVRRPTPRAPGSWSTSAHDEAKRALVELRDLVRGIHPAVLTDRGLDAALSRSPPARPCRSTSAVDVRRAPAAPRSRAAAYFVVSEALANVAKHAHAHARGRDVAPRAATGCSSRSPTTARRRRPARRDRPGRPARPRARAVDGRAAGVEPAGRADDPCEWSCHAHRDRRGLGAAARGADPAARPTPARRWSPPSATPTRWSTSSSRSSPTSWWSTCACRRPTPTRGSAPRSRSARDPDVAVLVLSQYVEEHYATELLAGDTARRRLPAEGPGRRRRATSSRRVRAGGGAGGTALDPEVVGAAAGPQPPARPARRASPPREREVLALMAEGRSNAGHRRASSW